MDKIQFLTDSIGNMPILARGEPFMTENGTSFFIGNGTENIQIGGGEGGGSGASNWSDITNTPNTLDGYGISDAMQVNATLSSGDISQIINMPAGAYRITNAVAGMMQAGLNWWGLWIKTDTPGNGLLIASQYGGMGNVTYNLVINNVFQTWDKFYTNLTGIADFIKKIGDTMTGALTTPGVFMTGYGNNPGMQSGNGDGATNAISNLKITSWYGIGFSPTISGQPVPYGENATWIDVRTGNVYTRGNIYAQTNQQVLTTAALLALPNI